MMLFVTIIPGYLSTTTPEEPLLALHLATFSVRVNMDISHTHMTRHAN